jgi:agmatinase
MRDQGMRWHTMAEIEEQGFEAVIRRSIQEASTSADVIYLSVDIDVVDPGSAPGTGTPEPGGLAPHQLLRAVRLIASEVPMVAMDVTEVSPPYDNSEVTAALASRCLLEALTGLALRRSTKSNAPDD